MDAGASTTDRLFKSFERFRQVWVKQGWSWDYRLECCASSFHVDMIPEAERSLATLFAEVYDHRTLTRAPEYLQELAEAVGGIRADQRIYTTRSGGRLNPYGLWWPWGDEITISLRIGLAGYTSDQDFQRLQLEFNTIG
jgi:hypothetical protein